MSSGGKNMKTVKFGGTSLADAAMMKQCAEILKADDERRFVIVSAPGKRFKDDIKVTDLLYQIHEECENGKDFLPTLEKVKERFAGIVKDLGIDFDLDGEFAKIAEGIHPSCNQSWLVSRGEYLNAKIFAEYMGRTIRGKYVPAAPLSILAMAAYLCTYLCVEYNGAPYQLTSGASFMLQIIWGVIVFIILIL